MVFLFLMFLLFVLPIHWRLVIIRFFMIFRPSVFGFRPLFFVSRFLTVRFLSRFSALLLANSTIWLTSIVLIATWTFLFLFLLFSLFLLFCFFLFFVAILLTLPFFLFFLFLALLTFSFLFLFLSFLSVSFFFHFFAYMVNTIPHHLPVKRVFVFVFFTTYAVSLVVVV